MKFLKDGQPCGHLGCLNHVTKTCEGCGRIKGIRYVGMSLSSLLDMQDQLKELAEELDDENRYQLLEEEQKYILSTYGDPR